MDSVSVSVLPTAVTGVDTAVLPTLSDTMVPSVSVPSSIPTSIMIGTETIPTGVSSSYSVPTVGTETGMMTILTETDAPTTMATSSSTKVGGSPTNSTSGAGPEPTDDDSAAGLGKGTVKLSLIFGTLAAFVLTNTVF